jgi:hypothetical protein
MPGLREGKTWGWVGGWVTYVSDGAQVFVPVLVVPRVTASTVVVLGIVVVVVVVSLFLAVLFLAVGRLRRRVLDEAAAHAQRSVPLHQRGRVSTKGIWGKNAHRLRSPPYPYLSKYLQLYIYIYIYIYSIYTYIQINIDIDTYGVGGRAGQ